MSMSNKEKFFFHCYGKIWHKDLFKDYDIHSINKDRSYDCWVIRATEFQLRFDKLTDNDIMNTIDESEFDNPELIARYEEAIKQCLAEMQAYEQYEYDLLTEQVRNFIEACDFDVKIVKVPSLVNSYTWEPASKKFIDTIFVTLQGGGKAMSGQLIEGDADYFIGWASAEMIKKSLNVRSRSGKRRSKM